jgi:hypothetical protein
LLAVSILLWVLASLSKGAYNDEYLTEKANVYKQQEMLEKLQSDNNNLKRELEELVQGRIPRLLPIEFNVTVPLNQDYIRSVNIILAGTSQNRYFEYHVMMHNEGSVRIEPNAYLLLFDELGIQVGKAYVSNEHATSEKVSSLLAPGETRSYSNRIKLDQEADPRYFLVNII